MLITAQAQTNGELTRVCFHSAASTGDAHPGVSQSDVFRKTDLMAHSDALARLDRSFDALRARLEARAHRRVGREDAEDLVGQCYLEARKSLCSRPDIRDVPSWLLRILDNLVLLHFRRARVRGEEAYPAEDADGVFPDTQDARGAEWDRAWLSRLLEAVDLTARQYECVQRLLAGETQQEIAVELGISQRMVSYHLQAALGHLRERQEEDALLHPVDFFEECARHAIYRKPHAWDNQSASEERERRRYHCLREEAQGQ